MHLVEDKKLRPGDFNKKFLLDLFNSIWSEQYKKEFQNSNSVVVGAEGDYLWKTDARWSYAILISNLDFTTRDYTNKYHTLIEEFVEDIKHKLEQFNIIADGKIYNVKANLPDTKESGSVTIYLSGAFDIKIEKQIRDHFISYANSPEKSDVKFTYGSEVTNISYYNHLTNTSYVMIVNFEYKVIELTNVSSSVPRISAISDNDLKFFDLLGYDLSRKQKTLARQDISDWWE